MLYLGKYFKIPVHVELGVIGILLVSLFCWGYVSALAWLSVYLFVLLHEFGHVFMGKIVGVSTDKIIIFPFGGMAEMNLFLLSPRREALVIAAGPVTSFVVGGFFAAAYGVLHFCAPNCEGYVISVVVWCAVLNISLGILNLVPIFPTDGGKLLRAAIHAWTRNYFRSTLITVRLGQCLALILGFVLVFTWHFWEAAICVFLVYSSQQELTGTSKRLLVLQVIIEAAPRLGLPSLVHAKSFEEVDKFSDILLADEEVVAKIKAILDGNLPVSNEPQPMSVPVQVHVTGGANAAPGANEGKLPPFLRSA